MAPVLPHKVTMKLYIDTKREKVLFAEASREVIDFIFNYFQGNFNLVMKQIAVRAFFNLYNSMKGIHTLRGWRRIAVPPVGAGDDDEQSTTTIPKLYVCDNRCGFFVTEEINSPCPNCKANLCYEVEYVRSRNNNNNTSSVANYAVMDDLVIEPLSSPTSKLELLSHFNVQSGFLKEELVELRSSQALNIWFASLNSDMVLTLLFLKHTAWSHMIVKRHNEP